MPVRLRVADRGVGPVQAELLLQPPHVLQTQRCDQPFGLGPVGMIDLDRDLRAERRSVPAHGIASPGASAAGQKCRAGRRRNDGDHAPAREICVVASAVLVS